MNVRVVELTKSVFKNNKILSLLLFIVIIGAIGFSLATPQVLKYTIDDYLLSNNKLSLLIPSILYFLSIMFLGIFNFLQAVIITIFGQKIVVKIKNEMIDKLEKLPIEYLSKNESGSIISRFTNDVESIGSLFTSGVVNMIVDLFKIVGIIISIWIFNDRLAMVVILVIPVVYFLTRAFQKRMLKSQKLYRILTAKVNNHIPESINNIEMIKSFCKEEYMEKKYSDYLSDSYNAMDKINFYDSVFSPIILILRSTVIAIVVVLCSDYLSIIEISIGSVAASIQLIMNIFSPIEDLGKKLQEIQQSIAGIYRVDEFFREKEEVEKDLSITYEDIIDDNLDIVFKDVDFSYDSNEEILKNISLTIKNKESVTFSGRTGAGKTTLFKLILGLLKPTEGKITISGVDVTKIPNNQKRKIFGYVEQEFSFIDGSVYDQITLKDKSISKEDVREVIKFVGLDDYIMNLENKYDTYASENNFSKGQCQLLSIARALVTSPKVMLLDEITANLDSKTEEKIITVLKQASSNRTVLSISHRLSSVLTSDRIIRLENKKIL